MKKSISISPNGQVEKEKKRKAFELQDNESKRTKLSLLSSLEPIVEKDAENENFDDLDLPALPDLPEIKGLLGPYPDLLIKEDVKPNIQVETFNVDEYYKNIENLVLNEANINQGYLLEKNPLMKKNFRVESPWYQFNKDKKPKAQLAIRDSLGPFLSSLSIAENPLFDSLVNSLKNLMADLNSISLLSFDRFIEEKTKHCRNDKFLVKLKAFMQQVDSKSKKYNQPRLLESLMKPYSNDHERYNNFLIGLEKGISDIELKKNLTQFRDTLEHLFKTQNKNINDNLSTFRL